MTDQSRTISLVILALIALTAIIGLVLMFKMSATGEVAGQTIITPASEAKPKKRVIPPQGSANYQPIKSWGSAIAAQEVVKVQKINVLGREVECWIPTFNQINRGLVYYKDAEDMSKCITLCEGEICDKYCCLPEYFKGEVVAG